MSNYETDAAVLDAPSPPMVNRFGEWLIIAPGHTFDSITEKISNVVLQMGTPRWWFGALLIGMAFAVGLFFALTVLVFKGIGIWGNNEPVGWAWDITNFVWWIGIGHAGTLISAILLLLKQEWRTTISRFSETMTIFAVMCAGLFPIFHTGRPWVAYWLFPLPNTMGVWPQFKSPLVWDVFAVSTYFTLSVVFWYIGLIPDLSTMRDRAKSSVVKKIYGTFAMGWRGSTRHWSRYETTCLLLAGLCTPLVVSVHSVVSMDFAVGIVPGWHTTIFPPYFVAGAVYSGFAMVLTLVLPARKLFHLEDFITMRHIESMAKVMLATGLIVGYAYVFEPFFGLVYSGNRYEKFLILNRAFGPYAPFYWTLILCNVITPQFLWWRKIRNNIVLLFIISIVVNIGMWLERFVIIAVSLHRDFLSSSWGAFRPTIFDILTFAGTLGLFLTLMLLFVRAVPTIPMFELKTSLPQAHRVGHPEEGTFEEEVAS
ncbi:MAG TPA: NrfD/PsrC family molybdoenzyme membrane anchor subunit [Candidatus Kapabacteria bacterium]|jgi:molybdopterin-containing oxidoreductase family membrane subunit|nr:NrfD/PsrC family molybdoenzyme membrane anchor subunit [Candidatus Kapabacteria bacterium]